MSVEDGALLLIRLYLADEELRRPEARAEKALDELAALAARLSGRLQEGDDAVEVVCALRGILFHEKGFCGNQQNYYDHRNSLLDHVLTMRTGIPISLSVVFAAVCRRVGVDLDMIGLPGHFLLATRPQHAGERRVFVDVFHGGEMLDLEACQTIVLAYGLTWSDQMATPVPVSEVWDRMLRNLLNCHKQRGEVQQVRMLQQLLLPPESMLPHPEDESSGMPMSTLEGQSPAVLLQMLQTMLHMP